MLNQTILVGRVKEIHKNGLKDEMSLTLCIPRAYKNAEGTYDNDFIPVYIKGETMVENVGDYLHKGDIVGIKGKIEADCLSLKIIAEKVTFLSSRNNEDEEA